MVKCLSLPLDLFSSTFIGNHTMLQVLLMHCLCASHSFVLVLKSICDPESCQFFAGDCAQSINAKPVLNLNSCEIQNCKNKNKNYIVYGSGNSVIK